MKRRPRYASEMNILVIGGTGTIGREIVAALQNHADVEVAVGGREPAIATPPGGVRRVAIDLDRPETVAPALAGVDKVAVVSPMRPDMAHQMEALVAAARAAGISHLVRSSLIGVDEPEPIAEAEWHAAADAVVRGGGIPYTILRPTQYFQNFITPRNAASVRDDGALYIPLGERAVSNIDARDLGEIAANVLRHPGSEHHGQVYVLTGGRAHTMYELADELAEALGKPVRYAPADREAFRAGLLKAGIPAVIADAILGWFAYCAAGRADRVVPDAARLLGRAPIDLRGFVRDHADRYR